MDAPSRANKKITNKNRDDIHNNVFFIQKILLVLCIIVSFNSQMDPGSWAHSNVTILFAVQIRLSIYLDGYNFEIPPT